MRDWRPRTGWDINLNDITLAKIGFLAVASEQARQMSVVCLKSVKGLNSEEWIKAQQLKFFQVTEALVEKSKDLDTELHKRVQALEEKRLSAEHLRHRFVHSIWGHNPDQNRPVSYDYKHTTLSTESELREALDGIAHMTLLSRRCLERVADLILDGKLKAGIRVGASISFTWRGQSVTF